MNYYCLIAGLPEIHIDDHKLAFTVADFKDEVRPQLNKEDSQLIDLFYTKFDNQNLLAYLKDKDAEFDTRGNLSKDELESGLMQLKEDDLPQSPHFPPYFKTFMEEYLDVQHVEENILWEIRLSELYYEWAMKCKNKMVSRWFEFNLDINNILTAYASRKYELDIPTQLIGDNEVAQSIRNSGQRDFGLTGTFEYLEEVQRIAEETDLFEREKKIDLLRWKWLDDNTFFKYFGVEQVFAYVVKLEIIERWIKLDPEEGEKIFRELIDNLKQVVVSGRDSINQQLNLL